MQESFKKYFQPGIYVIINKTLKKYYVGEATNIAYRFGDQYIQLKAQRNDSKELQQDWNTYGEEAFDFNILELGSEPWSDRVKRLGAERKYIEQYKNVYNKTGKVQIQQETLKGLVEVSNTNSIPIMIKDKIFGSVNQASKALNVSISTIRNKLNNPAYPDYKYVDDNRRAATNLARPIVVDDKYYASVNLAAAREGVSEKTIRKYIKELSNWNYFDNLTDDKKMQIKPDFKKNQGEFSQGRSVKVGDQVYPSIRQASIKYSIDSNTVRKRIKSGNFPEWKYFDS